MAVSPSCADAAEAAIAALAPTGIAGVLAPGVDDALGGRRRGNVKALIGLAYATRRVGRDQTVDEPEAPRIIGIHTRKNQSQKFLNTSPNRDHGPANRDVAKLTI